MSPKVREWLMRYGPAEVVSLPMTLLPALAVLAWSGSRVSAALAGTWGGNIGYFGVILLRDMLQTRRVLHREDRQYSAAVFGKNIRALIIEFGLAEVLDSLLVRPALMYYLPLLLHNFSGGILAAKVIADLSFYLPAIIFYEWSKKRFRRF